MFVSGKDAIGRFAMLPRHENELMTMLEHVSDHGAAHVGAWDLKRWFDKERITKTIFRTIEQRYALVDDDSTIFVGDLNGSYVFIYAKGLVAGNEAFFQPIETYLATW